MVARLFASDDARLMREGCANASFGTSAAGAHCGWARFSAPGCGRVSQKAVKCAILEAPVFVLASSARFLDGRASFLPVILVGYEYFTCGFPGKGSPGAPKSRLLPGRNIHLTPFFAGDREETFT